MNPLLQCEDAIVAELRAARREADATKPLFNRVDTYAGEHDEIFATLIRHTAPSAWVYLESYVNVPRPLEKLDRGGRKHYAIVPEDMGTIVWGIFLCTMSLRNPRELRRGALGVVGMYEVLNVVFDLANANAVLPGRLRNRKLLADWDTFTMESCEQVAVNQQACVFEARLKTRYQILNALPKPGGLDGGIFGPTPSGTLDGGRF